MHHNKRTERDLCGTWDETIKTLTKFIGLVYYIAKQQQKKTTKSKTKYKLYHMDIINVWRMNVCVVLQMILIS